MSVAEYRNIAPAGGRIFILGTGASLSTQLPLLPALAHEYTLAVNGLVQWDALPFTPTFYALGEPVRDELEARWEYLASTRWPGIVRFLPVNTRPGWVTIPRGCHEDDSVLRDGVSGFDGEIHLNGACGAVPAMTQLAAYMGFEEAYLLGQDCGGRYVYESERTHQNNYPERLAQSVQKISEAFHEHGRRLYDCTPNSFLVAAGAVEGRDLASVLKG